MAGGSQREWASRDIRWDCPRSTATTPPKLRAESCRQKERPPRLERPFFSLSAVYQRTRQTSWTMRAWLSPSKLVTRNESTLVPAIAFDVGMPLP
jgi:hypothetical protein